MEGSERRSRRDWEIREVNRTGIRTRNMGREAQDQKENWEIKGLGKKVRGSRGELENRNCKGDY